METFSSVTNVKHLAFTNVCLLTFSSITNVKQMFLSDICANVSFRHLCTVSHTYAMYVHECACVRVLCACTDKSICVQLYIYLCLSVYKDVVRTKFWGWGEFNIGDLHRIWSYFSTVSGFYNSEEFIRSGLKP